MFLPDGGTCPQQLQGFCEASDAAHIVNRWFLGIGQEPGARNWAISCRANRVSSARSKAPTPKTRMVKASLGRHACWPEGDHIRATASSTGWAIQSKMCSCQAKARWLGRCGETAVPRSNRARLWVTARVLGRHRYRRHVGVLSAHAGDEGSVPFDVTSVFEKRARLDAVWASASSRPYINTVTSGEVARSGGARVGMIVAVRPSDNAVVFNARTVAVETKTGASIVLSSTAPASQKILPG